MADMSYKEAAKIRESGLLNEVSKKLVAGGGVRESFKGAFKESVKARALGVKETFDPMNLGKKLTFGSPLGAALVGSLTGRSKEDMEYFTGFKAKKVKEPKAPKKLVGTESSKELIENLRNAFMEDMNYEKAVRDVRVDNIDKVEEQKEKRHKEVLSVLDTIFSTSGVEATKEKDSGSILSKMLGAAKLLGKGVAGKGGRGGGGGGGGRGGGRGRASTTISPSGSTVGRTVSGMFLASGLGLTALLSKAEAGSYDTVYGDQTGKSTPKPLSTMTLKEVDEFQSKPGLKSSAVGKYQIMRETLIEAKRVLNLKDSDIFDQNLQDKIFTEFLVGRKAGREKLNAYLSGKTEDDQKSLEEAQLQFAQEFAGIPVPFDVTRASDGVLIKKGKSYYGGIGQNPSEVQTTVEETQQRLKEQRKLNLSDAIAIGDSLAEGMQRYNILPGSSKAGEGPKAVFKRLTEYVEKNDIKGKKVYLGTGMPNNPSESDYVQKQIDLVKEKGGFPIVLGAGPGTEAKPTTGQNEKLKAMAEKSGATFTGPLEDMFPGMRQSDPTMGLHPTSEQYKQLHQKFSPASSVTKDKNKTTQSDKQNSSSTATRTFVDKGKVVGSDGLPVPDANGTRTFVDKGIRYDSTNSGNRAVPGFGGEWQYRMPEPVDKKNKLKDKVSSLSMDNLDLMDGLDYSSSFVLVNNNLMNINKKGDRILNVISNSGKSSDSILIQKQRA